MTPENGKKKDYSRALKNAAWTIIGLASVLVGAIVVAVGFGLFRLIEWLVNL